MLLRKWRERRAKLVDLREKETIALVTSSTYVALHNRMMTEGRLVEAGDYLEKALAVLEDFISYAQSIGQYREVRK